MATFDTIINEAILLQANLSVGTINLNEGNTGITFTGGTSFSIYDAVNLNSTISVFNFGDQLNPTNIVFEGNPQLDMSGSQNPTITFRATTATGDFQVIGPGAINLDDGIFLNSPSVTLNNDVEMTVSVQAPEGLQFSDLFLGDGCSLIARQGGTINTNITGTGSVIFLDVFFELTGNNTYSGGTTIESGVAVLSCTTDSILPSGNIHLGNTNFLQFQQDFEGTYSGIISSAVVLPNVGGTVRKIGTGNLILTNANTYFSKTSIETGSITLSGAGASIQNSILMTITDTGSFILEQDAGDKIINELQGGGNGINLNNNTLSITSGTFSGNISGVGGGLTKRSTGSLTLTGISSHTGFTTVSQGTLISNGSIIGPVLVEAAGTLKGTGSVGTTTNQGIVSPGNSIGTLTVEGDYIQSANGVYTVEIEPMGTSDLLEITGTATLSGAVSLEPQPGLYTIGTSYTILTAQGGLGGSQFTSLVESHPLDFSLQYTATTVTLIINNNAVILPIPLDMLTGNAKRVAEYVFCSSATDPHVLALQAELVSLPSRVFAKDLVELSPDIFGALGLSGLQNNIHVADMISQKAIHTICKNPACSTESNPFIFWVDPLAFLYKQKGVQDQIGFDLYTYGTAAGFELPVSDAGYLGIGAGFTHSDLFWKESAGACQTNTVYASPSIGFSNQVSYIHFLIQGSIDFYEVKRHIQFATIDTYAKNHHKSYNTLCRIDLGSNFKTGRSKSFILQPKASFNYLNLFEESYSEKGATNFINLAIKHKLTVFLQPNAGLKLIKEFYSKNYCFAPNCYVGWLANIPLSDASYQSKLYQMNIPCSNNFTVESFHRTTNQISLGAEFLLNKCENFLFKAGYKADFLSHFLIQGVYLKFNFKF